MSATDPRRAPAPDADAGADDEQVVTSDRAAWRDEPAADAPGAGDRGAETEATSEPSAGEAVPPAPALEDEDAAPQPPSEAVGDPLPPSRVEGDAEPEADEPAPARAGTTAPEAEPDAAQEPDDTAGDEEPAAARADGEPAPAADAAEAAGGESAPAAEQPSEASRVAAAEGEMAAAEPSAPDAASADASGAGPAEDEPIVPVVVVDGEAAEPVSAVHRSGEAVPEPPPDAGVATTTAPGSDAGSQPGATGSQRRLVSDLDGFRDRWNDVQVSFVDSPRGAVAGADELLSDVIEEIAAALSRERDAVGQWRDSDTSTDDLRLAFQRYRALFERLLEL